jgi:two-component system, NarL family, response regulator NreC
MELSRDAHAFACISGYHYFTKQQIAGPNCMAVKVFIADDHGVVREALKKLIDSNPAFQVIGEASGGQEVIEKVTELKPDVVIMDLGMPGIDGVKATATLIKNNPLTKVIALTAHEEGAYIRDCLAAGAKGYVLKRSLAEELQLALTVVSRGGTYLDPLVSTKLQDLLSEPQEVSTNKLSEREIQVVKLIARGLSAKETSKELNISVKTVETYKLRAMEKLALTSRADLVKHAVEHGWLQDESGV